MTDMDFTWKIGGAQGEGIDSAGRSSRSHCTAWVITFTPIAISCP